MGVLAAELMNAGKSALDTADIGLLYYSDNLSFMSQQDRKKGKGYETGEGVVLQE